MLEPRDTIEFVKYIPDDTYDLIICDAPYGKIVKNKWDNKTFEFDEAYINNLNRILKPTGNLYVHCGMGEKSNSLIKWFGEFEGSEFKFKDTITWKKTRGIGMRKGWLQVSEFMLWYVKDNKQKIWNKENQYSKEKRPFNIVKKGGAMVNKSEFKRYTTVWDIPEIGFGKSPRSLKELKKYITHFTPKHPFLSDRMIKAHCDKNSKVYIPFAGSGMEILSCIYNGIDFDATELDVDNIRIINEYVLSGKIKFEDFL